MITKMTTTVEQIGRELDATPRRETERRNRADGWDIAGVWLEPTPSMLM